MNFYKVLEAKEREVGKKSFTKLLIKNNFVPGVIYLKGKDSISVSFKKGDINEIADDPSGMTRLYEVEYNGKKIACILKEVQFNPVNDTARSVDFMEVKPKDVVNVNVPVRVLNREICPGVKNGGDIYMLSYNVNLKCNVENIPYAIEVDVKNSTMGEKFFLSDIKLPEGCQMVNNVILLRIAGKRVIKEEVLETSSDTTADSTSATTATAATDANAASTEKTEKK